MSSNSLNTVLRISKTANIVAFYLGQIEIFVSVLIAVIFRENYKIVDWSNTHFRYFISLLVCSPSGRTVQWKNLIPS